MFLNPDNLTFKAFSDKWLKEYAKPKLASKTIYEYNRLLKLRILPAIGHMKLNKIKPIHILEFYSNLQENGMRRDKRHVKDNKLSNNTIMHYHRLLHSIFQVAVKWQILESNPVSNVEPPKVQRIEAKYYSEDEVDKLVNALEDEELKYKIAILLTLATGMRLGELAGLTWDHIDIKDNNIDIVQSSEYLPDEGIFKKEPKNKTSIRKIAIPPEISSLLNKYKIEQDKSRLKCGDKWHNTNYIFTQWNGLPLYPYTISKWFSKFLKKNNMKYITFHQLRHTSAALLINADENIEEVSKRLGHSNTSTTLNIYAHAFKSADEDAAQKMSNILFKKDKLKPHKQT
ncbi:MAG: site-specific integrase [Clostridiales bacterium]|nr:site-specific integrase [Clostridiales bacterium]